MPILVSEKHKGKLESLVKTKSVHPEPFDKLWMHGKEIYAKNNDWLVSQ
ncbi:hypothetical protein [Neptunicella sp. SCSIO 80796]